MAAPGSEEAARMLLGGAAAWLGPDVGRVGVEFARADRSVVWVRLDGSGAEACWLRERSAGPVLRGTVSGAYDGRPFSCRYRVACTVDWLTQRAEVEVCGPDGIRSAVALERARGGRWRIDGVLEPELRGCVDVDLGVTPATNTLPIRRLGLREGERASMTAAWVRFPDLTVRPLPQAYRHQGRGRYRYESRNGAFTAELDVDDRGLVTRYADLWERAASWP